MSMSPFVAPCLSSQSLKIGPEFLRSKLARVSLVLTLLLSAWALPSLGQNPPNISSSAAIARIQWIPNKLLCLDAQTGRVESEIRLGGRPVGPRSC